MSHRGASAAPPPRPGCAGMVASRSMPRWLSDDAAGASDCASSTRTGTGAGLLAVPAPPALAIRDGSLVAGEASAASSAFVLSAPMWGVKGVSRCKVATKKTSRGHAPCGHDTAVVRARRRPRRRMDLGVRVHASARQPSLNNPSVGRADASTLRACSKTALRAWISLAGPYSCPRSAASVVMTLCMRHDAWCGVARVSTRKRERGWALHAPFRRAYLRLRGLQPSASLQYANAAVVSVQTSRDKGV